MYIVIIKIGHYDEPIIDDNIAYSIEDALNIIKDSKFHNEFSDAIYEIHEIKKVKEVRS